MSTESVENELEKLDIKHYDVNQFKDFKEIGAGAFSTVYRAKIIDSQSIDSNSDIEYVALKSFKANDDASLKVLLREIKLQKKVDMYDKIIRFYGLTKTTKVTQFDSKPSYVYALVLEFADSGTLSNYLQKNQSLSWFDKLHLAQQLADAIDHMYSADVHSNNILVHNNNIKISDFGISRCLAYATNTKSSIVGYIPYVDPDVYKNFERESYRIKKESDIYSLGVLLWEISSLRPPFKKYNDINALCFHILNGGEKFPLMELHHNILLYLPVCLLIHFYDFIFDIHHYYLLLNIGLFVEGCWQDDPGKRPKIGEVMAKLLDSTIYANDIKAKLRNLSYLQSNLSKLLPSQYLEHYEDVIMKAADLYESANSKTFTNVYETYLSKITDEVNVNFVINTLIPAAHNEHRKKFENYEEKKWMQIKYSEAFHLWKGVTDIKAELELINKVVKIDINDINDLENSLKHLTEIPKWKERLQILSTVVEIFKVPINTEDWLGRSLNIIRDDMLILGMVAEFVTYVKDHNPVDNENYWSFIKELSSASDPLEFLQTIAGHDIENLINDVDDFFDEQEDVVSLLIQAKQLAVQLMNKSIKIDDFLRSCKRLKLRNISNRGEMTKEMIQNAVLRGIYTFKKDDKSDKFNVTVVYQAREADKIKYNMSDLLCLRECALLIAQPANMNADLTEEEKSRKIINEFVLQVDTAQEILNVGSKFIQMGHFGYQRFKKEIIGTEERFGAIEMRDLLVKLKVDLQNWEKAVDEAQEQHYYLTFFPTLVKFVNNKAELPSREVGISISRDYNDSHVLNEIGKKLYAIFGFGKLLKTSREIKVKGERNAADVVYRGKICVASCDDKLHIPNVIMSLYANHGDNLFCIANLELLEFELQYSLVDDIRSMCEKHNDQFLALICCRKGSFYHHILDQFSQDAHSTNGLNAEAMKAIYHDLCSNITCVSSDVSGQGKTEWIKQVSLKKKNDLHSFLINDGANYESLVCRLKDFKVHPTESLHINIMSVDHPDEINMFLFELSTLGCVSGNINVISLSRIPIFIEVASTIQQKLLNSLPMTSYLIKEHLLWNIRNLNVSSELDSPIQIVCGYLDAFEKHEIDERDIIINGQNCIKKPLYDERCQDLIEKYFFKGFINSINSFRFVEIFTNVLADQLVRLSSSSYLTVENLKLLINEKTLLRTILVDTLINISREFAFRSIKAKAAQLNSTFNDYDSKFEMAQWDAYNYLFIIFKSQNPDSICALYQTENSVPENVKEFLKIQSMTDPDKWKLEDYNRMPPKLLLEILEYLARRTTLEIDPPQYALSADNLVKMALILLRVRSNVPIVIMGEAGCGKEQDILDFMDKAQKRADNGELWLFFDEINTCNHIGLLANIIAHRTFNGKLLHHNIRLFSACNPYRRRIKEQSQDRLKTKVKRYEELSSLVYEVKPLPDQILDYIWDYGILLPNYEKRYIQSMVQTRFGEVPDLFIELLFSSQQFIRSIEEKYSVSLRDVKRAIKLVDFFNESLRSRYSKNRQYPPNPDNPGRILFSIRCYILNAVAPNTAKNEALLENVLAMIVCILTKIPVFIIGVSGSSKSLAIKLVGQHLRGSDSNDKYFQKLPQVYLISYQGSSSSTSDGIIKVFEKANKYQGTSSKEFPVISVVVFDGIGLAETNSDNPLKVLHALLEPNYPSDGPSTSFVGIGNWKLDISKSSRALLVQRPKFSIDDLVDIAFCLFDSKLHNSITRASLRPLAEAYSEYEECGLPLPNFHGLRDYYELDWTCNPIPILALIKANLDDESARHLMVIGKSDSIVTILTHQLIDKGLDPVVILGSQFQDDQHDQQDYSYSVLSRIMICVESGRPLILTDLEIIYGALYDLWNQNYIVLGSKYDPKYYTRVALGAYTNPMLCVHKNFRCILVLDEKKLAFSDPELLNRFEKQKMIIDDFLTDEYQKIVKILSIWTQQMNETLQSLVIDILAKFPDDSEEAIIKRCKAALIDIASSDGIIRASRSIVDPGEIDQWSNVYFRNLTDEHIPLQNHDSLNSFFGQLLFTKTAISRFIINTFSNINTDVAECLRDLFTCQVDKLSTFKTETQLQNRIKWFWEESDKKMLILQCDITTVNGGCIKLAKFTIDEFLRKNPDNPKYICIILHIQRDQSYMSSFNYMCGWKQVTIETLTPQMKNLSTILNSSLIDIIKNEFKFQDILKHDLLWCLLCIKYPSTSKSVDHIK
ncbi:e3 ubiquitin-protein ligase [Gigaspora margarita]|uniref:E3 ubiquitin-protein ligase n=1 Tax=Gigaspora margarita TaxID=4874 RepID=A0A8H4B0P3_GIGMA|nr:e3 ubiquitin-protein ligase [Gigaspora margarita]